jgi:DNA polymerase III subunit beta
MKVHILQENLIKALTRTGRIISSKTQLPVLQNVLLSTEEGSLRLTTTNMEMVISTLVGAKVEMEGSVCVSSKLLTELVLSLPQGTVVLEENEGQLSVSTEHAHANLSELPTSEFPPLNLKTDKKGFKIEKKIIVSALGATLFAAATDEGRPTLTGIRIVSSDQGLVFVATDGYRLSVKTVKQENEKPLDLLVPSRALAETYKILTEEKEEKELVMDKNTDGQLCLTVGDTYIVARLIDGEYPPYAKIIPKTHTSQARFEREEFLKAVKSASIFARDNANIVRLHLDKNSIIVSANTPQVGQNTVEVESKNSGEEADIAFNSRFLIDFLNNCASDELIFEMTGSLNSGLFKPADDELFLHIIMPVRVQN